MNEAQSVFAVFFAIFLGTIANVQPRWKAFNWPLLFLMPPGKRGFIVRRLAASVAVLNVLPILYFAFALWMLIGHATPANDWTAYTVYSVVVHGVVPAFGAFAYYRLWLALIELSPATFYVENSTDLPSDLHSDGPFFVEPTTAILHITPRACCGNLVFGLLYLVIPALFLIRLR